MFLHEFGEDLVLALELLLQKGDPPVLGIAGVSGTGLEHGRGVFEELLLPAVEHRGVDAVPVTQVRDRGVFEEVKPQNGHLLLRREARPSFLGHGRISARRCSLFEQTICPISTEAKQIRETMKEAEVETIIQRAREQYPGEHPRIITDNGPQFVARDFKDFIRICGMTHVKTSPYYPQSNGKIERWFKTLKGECIRVTTPLSVEDARRLVAEFVTHYNTVRLHSAIAYITPADKLAGRAEAIWAARREKLAQADARRRAKAQTKTQ